MEKITPARHNAASLSNSEFTRAEGTVSKAIDRYPLSFYDLNRIGLELGLSPPVLGAYLETAYVRRRDHVTTQVEDVWSRAADKLQSVMFNSVRKGMEGNNPLQVLNGKWAAELSRHTSILGAGWSAFTAAIGVQELTRQKNSWVS